MTDETPREFRRALGEGWTEVVSTAHRDALIYLEGPAGIRATVPQEQAEEAFRYLRIPVTFRHRRGRPPKITRNKLIVAIIQEHEAGAKPPSQEAVAERLTIDRRHVQRVKPDGVSWAEFVKSVVDGWDYILSHPEVVKDRRSAEPPTP